MTNGRSATTAFAITLLLISGVTAQESQDRSACHSKWFDGGRPPAFNQFMEDCLSKLKAERLRTEQRTQYINEEM